MIWPFRIQISAKLLNFIKHAPPPSFVYLQYHWPFSLCVWFQYTQHILMFQSNYSKICLSFHLWFSRHLYTCTWFHQRQPRKLWAWLTFFPGQVFWKINCYNPKHLSIYNPKYTFVTINSLQRFPTNDVLKFNLGVWT